MSDQMGKVVVRAAQLCVWAVLPGIAAGSAASAVTPEQAEQVIEARIFKYREIGTAFKNMKDELAAKQPDVAKIRAAALLIHEHGRTMLDWFPAGSEPAPSKGWLERILDWFSSDDAHAIEIKDTKSDAKAVIWTERAQFEQKYRAFAVEAERTRKAADAGQISLITSQHKKLGQTCSGCHDVYREESD